MINKNQIIKNIEEIAQVYSFEENKIIVQEVEKLQVEINSIKEYFRQKYLLLHFEGDIPSMVGLSGTSENEEEDYSYDTGEK